MKLVLVVVGDGRKSYLDQAVPACGKHVFTPFQARVMVNDHDDIDYSKSLRDQYPEFNHVDTFRSGMAGAVGWGFATALYYDPDFVFWLEEDMLVTERLPLAEAATAMNRNGRLAQMLFPREPWHNSLEQELGQWGALKAQSAFPEVKADYLVQDFIFSLNPCLIPRHILELGWDDDNEAGMTRKLQDLGYQFGVWGKGETYARHIGHERSADWKL